MTRIERLLTRPLTITPRSAGANDSYGNPVQGDGTPVEVLGALWVANSRDENAAGAVVRSEARAALPASTAIDTGDQITDEQDRDWQVDGEPDHVWNARLRRVSHIEVALRRGT